MFFYHTSRVTALLGTAIKKGEKKIYRQLLFRENHLKPTVELCLLKTHVTERDKGGLIARIIFNFLALQTKTVTLNKHFCFTPL